MDFTLGSFISKRHLLLLIFLSTELRIRYYFLLYPEMWSSFFWELLLVDLLEGKEEAL